MTLPFLRLPFLEPIANSSSDKPRHLPNVGWSIESNTRLLTRPLVRAQRHLAKCESIWPAVEKRRDAILRRMTSDLSRRHRDVLHRSITPVHVIAEPVVPL